jgi:transposase
MSTRSFAAMALPGGIYDNMKTAVDKVKKGKAHRQQRFAAMCTHHLVDADFAWPLAGRRASVIEKNVQTARV